MPARKPQSEKKPPAKTARAKTVQVHAQPSEPVPAQAPTKGAGPAQNQDKYRQDAIAAANAAIAKQAIEPVLIDLSTAHSYTDYLLVTSGQGSRGVSAIAEHVEKALAERGVRSLGSEGVREGHWALLDFGDVVVHVFDHNLREFYDLEGMWFDSPRIELAIPAEQRLAAQTLRYDDLPPEDGPEAAVAPRGQRDTSYGAQD